VIPQPPTAIPNITVVATVLWSGAAAPHDKAQTAWSVIDGEYVPSVAVSVQPNLEPAAGDEDSAVVTYLMDHGLFRLVATAPGMHGGTAVARSPLYSIIPGSPIVPSIVLSVLPPAPTTLPPAPTPVAPGPPAPPVPPSPPAPPA